MTANIILKQTKDILEVELNRPDRLNALDDHMIDELRTLFQNLCWKPDIRVVVLSGAGRAFCAGLDLKRERDKRPDERTAVEILTIQRRISEIVIAMRRCPQPIIALVDGPASGGGFALALASDVRLGSPRTRLNAAFIKLGLSACDIGVSYFLPRMVGASVAAQYMLTGAFIEAARALELNLLYKIVEPDEIGAEGLALATQMLQATPLGLRLTKDALNHAIDANGLEAAIAIEDRNQTLCAGDPNFSEGLRAFLEKRLPRYTQN